MNPKSLLDAFAQRLNYASWIDYINHSTKNYGRTKTCALFSFNDFENFASLACEQHEKELEEIRIKIAKLPNRDSWFQDQFCETYKIKSPIKLAVFDGGGVRKFDVMKLLEDKVKKK